MVPSMMFFKNVKLMFWVDEILCVVYLRNRILAHALNNKTPYEMWHGLNFIGSLSCYQYIPRY